MARGNRADTTRSAAARRISNEDAEALTLYITATWYRLLSKPSKN